VLGLLVGSIATLVVQAPAGWLAYAVEVATDGRIRLPDASGTVWSGSSRWMLTGGTGSKDGLALPGQLQLDAGWRTASVRVVDASIPTTDAATSRWPAQLLSGLGAPWNTLQPEGTIELATQALTITFAGGRMALTGQAVFTARDMSSRLSTIRPMGTYRVQLLGGAPVSLNVTTVQGALQFSGQGQWVGSRLRFTGEASAEPPFEDALSNLLNIIGRRSGPRSIITIG
jgi:general secretion pathway protein N